MSGADGEAGAGRPAVAFESRRWRGALDRFLPAAERSDALWIAGSAVLLGTARALLYPPLQRFVQEHVASPHAEEFGFALRATAVADMAWVVVAGVLIWAILRFTRAPRALALYLVLSGVLVAAVSFGNRLALDAVLELAGSVYKRSIWSDTQPMMLALAEAAGVVLGAWCAEFGSQAARPPDGSTLLPAVGWEGAPLRGAARLAVAWTVARVVAQLGIALVLFVPGAASMWFIVHPPESMSSFEWLSRADRLLPLVVYFLVGYLSVRWYCAPRSVWLPFAATGVPVLVNSLLFLPVQARVLIGSGVQPTAWWAISLVAWPIGVALPLLGVWLATRPVPGSSGTLA